MIAAGRGRPLRFMGLVLGGWVAARTWWLWPVATPIATGPWRAILPVAIAATAPVEPREIATTTPPSFPTPRRPSPLRFVTPTVATPATIAALPDRSAPPAASAARADDRRVTLALLGMVRYGAPVPPPPGPSRWSGSLWSIVRDGRQRAGVATPQLGGSQIGARIAYTLDDARRVAIVARASGALAVRQQELALGIEWQPGALPARVTLERRIGAAGIRSGTAIGVAGGVGDRDLAAGFRLDGYAQAGAIARDGMEGYADGAIRIARPVARSHGGIALDLGIGAWGAAQRGAARFDIGPTAAVTLPAGARRLRVTLDWRQRVAGNAAPVSGPALSLGTDF
ncbi:hypothetical protein [Sphingomonas adhaesiva]|uniref:hypothetical protein n=1 Tax=Sphingomonas adhaesiva TaxID=28212 RepID=UPI002FF7D01E